MAPSPIRPLDPRAQQPSRTVASGANGFLRQVRQAPASTVTVVTTTSTSGGGGSQLSGGAIAGIVIGSVAGFLLLLWIIRSCTNLGAPPQEREAWYRDVGPTHRHRSQRHRDRYYADGSGYRRSSSASRRPDVYTASTIAEPVPVAVRSNSRRRASTSKPRSPRRSGSAFVIEERQGRTGRYYDSY